MDARATRPLALRSEPFVKEPPVALSRDRKSGIIGTYKTHDDDTVPEYGDAQDIASSVCGRVTATANERTDHQA